MVVISSTILHDRECETGVDSTPVDQNRAGAALAMIAALLGAGQIKMVPQQVEQGRPRLDLELGCAAVDHQLYCNPILYRDGRLSRACLRHFSPPHEWRKVIPQLVASYPINDPCGRWQVLPHRDHIVRATSRR